MTKKEVIQILKKYDPEYYEDCTRRGIPIGSGAKKWAEVLKREHEEKENNKNES